MAKTAGGNGTARSKVGQRGGTQGPGRGYSNRVAKRGSVGQGYQPPKPTVAPKSQHSSSAISSAMDTGVAAQKRGYGYLQTSADRKK